LQDEQFTMDLVFAFPEVRRVLQSWVGYECLAEILAECPDLQVFLAGGAVRNCFLTPPLEVQDFDFFVNGPSLERALKILERHGTLLQTPYGAPRWHPAQNSECYADFIPIRDFKPGLWQCEDIVDVLNQFDFTVSALAFDLRTERGFDPQNGFRDLTRRTMKMVRFDYPDGPFIAGETLSRNVILWFRILHYARVLKLIIEPLTLNWLRRHLDYQQHAGIFSALFFPPHEGYLQPL
jgi:hypothetical protein